MNQILNDYEILTIEIVHRLSWLIDLFHFILIEYFLSNFLSASLISFSSFLYFLISLVDKAQYSLEQLQGPIVLTQFSISVSPFSKNSILFLIYSSSF